VPDRRNLWDDQDNDGMTVNIRTTDEIRWEWRTQKEIARDR